ncbi:hypothetical protein CC85DRAFT_146955 [Cutaneotrichosporon oleaginosum]|uniref:F-box domain-containing protein n=1 Tax=Cutaneotrichosporon oleaginosum TaxID=879819 RepID=A0A0J1AZ35_9TREE|nr:uncharacterized protein CC85DRAFT_146955 [Cutaneotrichosporon oleaginosum]KLT40594.1 hypothetical protein CC85DRAFT_146955 [Cutaneotrichosporon oleaginosum]TXT03919.1 hypothetical protein COLE_07616 [Cutaneotrichosporon oleaginosum]
MAVPAKPVKPPSMASLSLEERGAVADDELEAFRRAWRAEVEAKKEVEVDAGGVMWKGTGEKKESGSTDKVKDGEGKSKGKGKGKGQDKPKAGDDEWPAAPPPPIPVTAVRSRSPTKASPRSPTKPASPLRSPTKQLTRIRSPTKTSAPTPLPPPRSPTKPTREAAAAAATPTDSEVDSDTMPFPQRRRTGDAVALYTRAVEAEQGGRLSDALHLYRRAFRADDNVDRLYALSVRRAEAERARAAEEAGPEQADETPTPTPVDIVDPSAPELPAYQFTREVQVQPDYEREGDRVSRLTALLEARVGDPASFPEGEEGDPALSFRPADPALPMPLAALPGELLDRVLLFLDVMALERFGATCWRARLLTAHAAAWKRLAERIYVPPMVESIAVGRSLARRHRDEWRTTLLEEERLRMDGAYISVCHYIRPGAGEQWVTITHMITYHRFLRFYPDGHVISFLTTDHPSEVVPLLKPTLRAKGLHFGRWQLVRSEDKRGRKRPRVLITDLIEPGSNAKYEFEMELTLRETGRGRWNKLDLVSYSSINLATGEALGLSLKHQKPFYFSKVRSYNPPF